METKDILQILAIFALLLERSISIVRARVNNKKNHHNPCRYAESGLKDRVDELRDDVNKLGDDIIVIGKDVAILKDRGKNKRDRSTDQ